MNKLGIAFNCFSATELLPYAVKQLREVADHITCIYQEKSYQGKSIPMVNKSIMFSLYLDGLVDSIHEVDVGFIHKPKNAEAFKRNQGKNYLLKEGCTHFCTMDEDELYHTDQFAGAYKDFILSGADASACQMQTYYKHPTLALKEPEEYYVPLFYKMDDRQFKVPTRFPVVADPSRKLETKNFLQFEREQIEMHHYSFVRKDITTKFDHSPSVKNYSTRLPEIIERWENYKEGDLALWAGSERKEHELKTVPNHFNIQL